MTTFRTVTPQPVKVYFENLNAIRFIAAFLVIVHHIEQFKDMLQVPNHWGNPVVLIIGKLGVILFFVLSGFLISYLLFTEQTLTSTISIKDFYIRRMLRIWPLYFLVVLAAFFIIPLIPFLTMPGYPRSTVFSSFFAKLSLYVLFLPQVALYAFGRLPYASQVWSIGAEEQFYLVWPALNKLIKNKWLLMISVIGGYLFIKFIVVNHFFPPGVARTLFSTIWNGTPIDCMAIGGLYAVILYESSPLAIALRRVIFARAVQWVVLVVTMILVLRGVYFPYFHYELYAVLFGLLICNFAANPQRIFSMEYTSTNYLGKISYGLYMFHPVIIVLSIKVLQKIRLLQDTILYPTIITLVIGIATLSYNFFEKRFINQKIKYAKVVSGNEAKETREAKVPVIKTAELEAY